MNAGQIILLIYAVGCFVSHIYAQAANKLAKDSKIELSSILMCTFMWPIVVIASVILGGLLFFSRLAETVSVQIALLGTEKNSDS